MPTSKKVLAALESILTPEQKAEFAALTAKATRDTRKYAAYLTAEQAATIVEMYPDIRLEIANPSKAKPANAE